MDVELSNVISYIQSIKHDLYLKHKPQLIDGKTALLNQQPIQITYDDTSQTKPYQRLMMQQRQILYGNNFEAQEAAFKRLEIQEQPSGKIKLTFKKDQEPASNPVTSQPSDFCKTWSKLPNNLKIQVTLKFIEALTPKLTDDMKNQLRFLLISAISEKKLSKQTDVDYDVDQGCISRINKLSYDGTTFSLSENGTVIFPFSINHSRKKLLLIKK